MDGLSTTLNTCQTGCYSGVSKVNHLMYADDLVLLSPCTVGLSRLLKCCDDYAVSHDIVYNVSKSCVLICSPNKTVTDPVFYIQNNIIERKTKAKYLGHIISDDMSDDADVFRQVKCEENTRQYYIEEICKLQHKRETCFFFKHTVHAYILLNYGILVYLEQ